MAKKKATPARPPARPLVEKGDNVKPLTSPRDRSADKDFHNLKDANYLHNLKDVNDLLVKGNMERQLQINQLKAQIEEVTDTTPFFADIQREVSRIVVAAAISDEAVKVSSLQKTLVLAMKERDEMRSVSLERDAIKKEVESRRKEVGELEARIRDLEMADAEIRVRFEKVVNERDESERLRRKKEEAFESLQELMVEVEKEKAEMCRQHEKELKAMAVETVEAVKKATILDEEIRVLTGESELVKREGERLRLQVSELADKNGEAREEIDRIKRIVTVLEEKKGREIRELELDLSELRKKVGEISREKDEVEKVRAEREAEVLVLKNEVKKLQSNVVGLEEKGKDFGKNNGLLVGENDAVKKELVSLGKEMAEKEKGFEVKVGELMVNLNDVTAKMRVITAEKDEIENVRAEQEVEFVRLKKETEKLILNVAGLQEMCISYSEKSAKLQDESDAVKRELVVQKDYSSKLRSQVEGLEREIVEKEKGFEAKVSKLMVMLENLSAKLEEISADKAEVEIVRAKQDVEIVGFKKEVQKFLSYVSELEERITQLQVESDAVKKELSERVNELGRHRALVEELEKSKEDWVIEVKKLSASLSALMAEKEEVEGRLVKVNQEMRAAEMFRDKALALLKSTADFMEGTDIARENGTTHEEEEEEEEEEEIRPFAKELHNIKGALRNRAVKMEEMNKELAVLKKKKRGLMMMWLYPVTTTFLAAVSLAYARWR